MLHLHAFLCIHDAVLSYNYISPSWFYQCLHTPVCLRDVVLTAVTQDLLHHERQGNCVATLFLQPAASIDQSEAGNMQWRAIRKLKIISVILCPLCEKGKKWIRTEGIMSVCLHIHVHILHYWTNKATMSLCSSITLWTDMERWYWKKCCIRKIHWKSSGEFGVHTFPI